MKYRRLCTVLLGAVMAAGILVAPTPANAGGRDCDDDYRPRYRSSRSYRSYDYDDDYCRPRYRRERVEYRSVSYGGGYRCNDCGDRFGSSYWLTYHRRHTSCD